MRFTKNELTACISHASTDSSRYNLNAIRFESGCIVATDGHRIMRIEDDTRKTELDDSFSISIGDAKKLALMIGKADECEPARSVHQRECKPWRTFEICGAAPDSHGFAQIDDHTYVDYRACSPTDAVLATVTVSAKYLSAMANAVIKAGARGKNSPVKLELRGELIPVVFTSDAVNGLIMPMRA